jgi:hypothetical protein
MDKGCGSRGFRKCSVHSRVPMAAMLSTPFAGWVAHSPTRCTTRSARPTWSSANPCNPGRQRGQIPWHGPVQWPPWIRAVPTRARTRPARLSSASSSRTAARRTPTDRLMVSCADIVAIVVLWCIIRFSLYIVWFQLYVNSLIFTGRPGQSQSHVSMAMQNAGNIMHQLRSRCGVTPLVSNGVVENILFDRCSQIYTYACIHYYALFILAVSSDLCVTALGTPCWLRPWRP